MQARKTIRVILLPTLSAISGMRMQPTIVRVEVTAPPSAESLRNCVFAIPSMAAIFSIAVGTYTVPLQRPRMTATMTTEETTVTLRYSLLNMDLNAFQELMFPPILSLALSHLSGSFVVYLMYIMKATGITPRMSMPPEADDGLQEQRCQGSEEVAEVVAGVE